jgi:hypothetical protein
LVGVSARQFSFFDRFFFFLFVAVVTKIDTHRYIKTIEKIKNKPVIVVIVEESMSLWLVAARLAARRVARQPNLQSRDLGLLDKTKKIVLHKNKKILVARWCLLRQHLD